MAEPWLSLPYWLAHWEEEAPPQWRDFHLAVAFAAAFPLARYALDTLVFERAGRALVLSQAAGGGGGEAGAAALARTHAKFKESCWKATYYSASELLALAVTVPEPWFLDTEKYWLGPGDQCWPDQLIKYKLKTLYMFMGGFYTYSIFALVFWETRRKDFGVSMAHHVASVLLIVFSYVARFARIGSVVVAIHDASDVWLELAKLSRYCQFDLGATTNFALFALSWLLLRLVYYPFWVIWSTTYEVLKVLNKEKHKYDGPVLYYTFNTLLIMLLVLHIYWWILIYRILVKQLFASGTVAKDDREDSEDED